MQLLKDFMNFRFFPVVIASICMVLFSTGCSTMADAKAGKGTGISQTFSVASDRVWQVLPSAVKSAGLDYVSGNKDEGYALAQRGLSVLSYGENVAIFIDKPTAASTKVEVVSKKAMATNVFAPDWAQPILDKIAEMLK
jgi:hypothetical protein